jgi:hypothetical protein
MVKQIIKEAMDQNPLGLKEAVETELRARIALALESKMEESVDLGEAFKVGTKVRIHSEKDDDHGKSGKVVKSDRGMYVVQFDNGQRGSFNEDELVNESVDLEEAKMTDAEVLSAAKALAVNGKDAKTKAFGKGLVDFYKKEGSFTPAQVGGLQNIMKNASFQMAKESRDLSEVDMGQAKSVQDRRDSVKSGGNKYQVANKNGNVVSNHDNQGDAIRAAMKNDDYKVKRVVKESIGLDEGVVGAGPAFFDDGSHTEISDKDAAAINRMFASKTTEEQSAARKKMKATRSYYNTILAKARKG